MKKVYENCAISVVGGTKILLVKGGAGTGKTTFIHDLLKQFSKEEFQYTGSILVCGMNNALVDSLAARVFRSKIQNIGEILKSALKFNLKHNFCYI